MFLAFCRGAIVKQFFIFLSAILLAASISITIAAREPSSISSVVPPVTAPPRTYLGFDRDLYPGDAAFPTLRKTFAFTGYWLSPPPTEKTTTSASAISYATLDLVFWFYFAGATAANLRKAPTGRPKDYWTPRPPQRPRKERAFPLAQSFFSI
jgi:hypothetical protein